MLTFLAAFLLFYLWHGMGITVGYHRLLAHRSFRCNKPFEYFWVAGGYLAYQGSPIWWAAIHRAHHKYSDTPLDPHSPKQHGVFHALFGWLFTPEYPDHIDPNLQCKDLVDDPIYRVLETGGNIIAMNSLNAVVNLLFRGTLWLLLGWQVALASWLASMSVFTIPLMLNVICHMPRLGYRNFAAGDDSVNVWWVGLLGLGEGWHNNHHAFPGSARTGIRQYEVDISWATIKLGRLLGWVKSANEPAAIVRFARRGRPGARARLRRRLRIRRLALQEAS